MFAKKVGTVHLTSSELFFFFNLRANSLLPRYKSAGFPNQLKTDKNLTKKRQKQIGESY